MSEYLSKELIISSEQFKYAEKSPIERFILANFSHSKITFSLSSKYPYKNALTGLGISSTNTKLNKSLANIWIFSSDRTSKIFFLNKL